MNRRTLSKREWEYIKYGDVAAIALRERQLSADKISILRKPTQEQSTIASRRGFGRLFISSSPRQTRRLENALEGFEWESASSTASSPPPVQTPTASQRSTPTLGPTPTLTQCSSPSRASSHDFELQPWTEFQSLSPELEEKTTRAQTHDTQL
jgi:hypothetical protein